MAASCTECPFQQSVVFTTAVVLPCSYRGRVRNDEHGSEQATAALAVMTDEQQVADIRACFDAVLAGWWSWRSGPDYPAAGLRSRYMAELLERIVATLDAGVRALPGDAGLHETARIAWPLLGAYMPEGVRGAGRFDGAVERLRWLAIGRPALVAGARRLMA